MGLTPAIFARTDTRGRVGFMPAVRDSSSRMTRYVPLVMPRKRAWQVATEMAGGRPVAK